MSGAEALANMPDVCTCRARPQASVLTVRPHRASASWAVPPSTTVLQIEGGGHGCILNATTR